MHKVSYLPVANEDIMEAVDYLAVRLCATGAADALLTELDRTVEQIARMPYACELYRTDRPLKDEIRKVPVKGFVLYYAVYQDRVEIRRFLHGRRNRDDLFPPEDAETEK